MRHRQGTDHTPRPGGAPDVEGRSVRRLRAPDGPEIAVHRLGPEDPAEGADGRPDLLLAHATGFCGPVLAPLADHLAPAFTCWALDERGHGRSDTPVDEDFDWHGFAT
ncbi:MAG TPA: hypothetical protein VE152_03435, partial [Acidimicrobiales bacterium]|nr:hypothetical protein [Acidimicrobiales bacterium]